MNQNLKEKQASRHGYSLNVTYVKEYTWSLLALKN